MLQQSELERNRELMSNFLQIRPIPKKYQLKDPFEKPFGYIYCIEYIKKGTKYIGSSYSIWQGVQRPTAYSSLTKRASQYLYEYNRAIKNSSTTAKRNYRPILRAMIEYGFENFIMYPIAETTRDNHIDMENYFIDIFDSINSGYNIPHSSANINKIGRKMIAKDKQLRSEGIICINMNKKQIIFSESMKLFGNYMNSSKDMIKNSVRKGRPYKGWFIFYINVNKRADILERNVLGDCLPVGDRHSEKSKTFYKELYTTIDMYLKDNTNKEYFQDFEILPELVYKDE